MELFLIIKFAKSYLCYSITLKNISLWKTIMYKISVDRQLFEDILLKKTLILTRENNKHWKKELLDIKVVNNKISYGIKQFDKLTISNGLGEDKPQLVVECKNINYSTSFDRFEFNLGKVLEQKNTDFQEDYKDTLIEQLLKEKQLLEDTINKDHLTQVYNRRKMETDLEMFVEQNNSFLLTSIFIDADRFKGINDNFGHDMGDKTLQYLGKKLAEHSKKLNGEVYRYGGEEFVILCFLAKDRLISKLNALKEDIKAQRIPHEKRDIAITVSMGVSFYQDTNDKDKMLRDADNAVYKAKSNGRDRIEFA